MAVKQRKYLGECRARICVRENGQLVTKPVDIFGSVRAIVGKVTPEEQIARLVYDLRQKRHRNFVKVELATGGEYNEELGGYKNWFPGSDTFGFIRDHDAYLYDANGHQLKDEFDNNLYVPMWGQGNSKEDSTVEILDILDAVVLDPALNAGVKFHVKTSSGIIGYIDAQNITNIFYKARAH